MTGLHFLCAAHNNAHARIYAYRIIMEEKEDTYAEIFRSEHGV